MALPPHLLIVESRFYSEISDQLVAGAEAAIAKAGASAERITVPGAFEVPAAIRFALKGLELMAVPRRYDAYVALGCVIRGETTHYDYVCQESARGLMELSLQFCIAVGYGILTCENYDQAWERARVDAGDKGGKAATAALTMLELKRRFGFFPG
ncbi:MAG: 6,7-dimethyl-8-ribityllumazine synthase [Alphaproteobacteria bacterium]|nr:6,7-dimethyl-8-ribityllumazine synthase [Alphaproteobacteria bacterium]